MKVSSKFRINASWRREYESPPQLAMRLAELVGSLRGLSPYFQKWFHENPAGTRLDRFDGHIDSLAATIAANMGVNDDGKTNPRMGYSVHLLNSEDCDLGPDAWYIWCEAGGIGRQYLQLAVNDGGPVDAECMTYPVVKDAVLAISRAFAPDWSAVAPHDLGDLLNYSDPRYKSPALPPAWIINLSPELAKLVVPPPASIYSYADDGSLFMTATTETFVTQNPEHLAAARAIYAVTDPLNFKPPLNDRTI